MYFVEMDQRLHFITVGKNQEKNKSVQEKVSPFDINAIVGTHGRRRICVYFCLSLISSACLVSQLRFYVSTPMYRYYAKPKEVMYQPNTTPYHQPNTTPYHQPKHIFDHAFTLAEPLTCLNESGQPRPVFLLVMITSSSSNFDRRQAIRETWGSPKNIMGKNITTVFLLGKTGSVTPKVHGLQKESATHHDILQADFLDTYKNLTIKTIVGMKWINTYCSHASYFMKTDDDMYISYANIIKNLSAPSTPPNNFAMGHLMRRAKPSRSKSHKFYISKDVFPDKFYPPYLVGAGYVLSGDLANKIYRVSPGVKFMVFEDVFVGLCLKTLHVVPIGHSGFTYSHINYEVCEYRNHRMLSHAVQPKEMHTIWKDLKDNPKQC